MEKRQRKSGVDGSSPGEAGFRRVLPDCFHDRRVLDESPARMAAVGLTDGCGFRTAEGFLKNRRIPQQKIEFNHYKLAEYDVFSSVAICDKTESGFVLGQSLFCE